MPADLIQVLRCPTPQTRAQTDKGRLRIDIVCSRYSFLKNNLLISSQCFGVGEHGGLGGKAGLPNASVHAQTCMHNRSRMYQVLAGGSKYSLNCIYQSPMNQYMSIYAHVPCWYMSRFAVVSVCTCIYVHVRHAHAFVYGHAYVCMHVCLHA